MYQFSDQISEVRDDAKSSKLAEALNRQDAGIVELEFFPLLDRACLAVDGFIRDCRTAAPREKSTKCHGRPEPCPLR